MPAACAPWSMPTLLPRLCLPPSISSMPGPRDFPVSTTPAALLMCLPATPSSLPPLFLLPSTNLPAAGTLAVPAAQMPGGAQSSGKVAAKANASLPIAAKGGKYMSPYSLRNLAGRDQAP
eukprot:355819-Chlamydomonas_euryale.AAC.4